MENKVDLFVPGRLCLMGEHSDWAGTYRNLNNEINKGYALVTGIEEGIYATAKPCKSLIVRNAREPSKSFEIAMDLDELKNVAESGEYWSYVAGVAATVKEQYNVEGLEITINDVTLPEKKGLSSSASICVLVARAFNQIYNLHLNTIGEMNIGYQGEILTPSRCGRLDQACAFGKKPVLLTFDGNKLGVQNLKVGKDMYFVFADLNARKDTIKILGDLNKCFPFAQTVLDRNVQMGLGVRNEELVFLALEYIKKGDVEKYGELMTKYQMMFDKLVAPACPQELTAPILHGVLNDEFIKKYTYGGKGVGSQGDGCVQFLAKDAESQKIIIDYLNNVLHMNAYKLTLERTKPITKAIIPLAGNGTRMYPITKLVKKAFLPIIDNNIVKPFIMVLLEELDEAGIEKICLVIDKNDQSDYDNFFNSPISEEVARKLSPELLEYEAKIQRIGKKIQYVYQEEKLGFGHAVSLCEEFTDGENVLLALGDQFYISGSNKSCTTQLLENFEKTGLLTVSVCPVDLSDVSRYGILCGNFNKSDDYFMVDKMVEKPDIQYAQEYLYTRRGTEKCFYSVLGEYILTPSVFARLRDNISNKRTDKSGEYELTSVLDYVREKEGMIAFAADGELMDIGNVNSYKKSLIKKMK